MMMIDDDDDDDDDHEVDDDDYDDDDADNADEAAMHIIEPTLLHTLKQAYQFFYRASLLFRLHMFLVSAGVMVSP